jgi:hypothetical protein
MSIRRIGSNPFVSTASLIQSQRRIDPVEKHLGAEDTEIKSEEEALEVLNELHHAELEALQAEREQKAKETESLRAQLLLKDGYEARPEELVDLTGGAREAYERDLLELQAREKAKANKPGVSLAQLARANVYERVSREERAAAQRAELERAEAERIAAELAAAEQAEAAAEERVPLLDEEALPTEADEEVDWMAEELAMLQGEDEELDVSGEEDEEEEYSDPAADSFLASLEDIENLETEPAEDPHAGGFLASLDDIAQLVPGSDAEAEAEWAPEVSSEAGEDFAVEAGDEAVQYEDESGAVSDREPEAEAAVALPFDDEDIPR